MGEFPSCGSHSPNLTSRTHPRAQLLPTQSVLVYGGPQEPCSSAVLLDPLPLQNY